MPKYQITAVAEIGYHLILNPMQSNTETRTIVQSFPTIQQLQEFYTSQKVEPYVDSAPSSFHDGVHTYLKCFRKNGPLEWYNPADEAVLSGHLDAYGFGITEFYHNVSNIQKLHQVY